MRPGALVTFGLLLFVVVVAAVFAVSRVLLTVEYILLLGASAFLAFLIPIVVTGLRQPTFFFDPKLFGFGGIFVFLIVSMLKSVFIYERPVTDNVWTAARAALLVATATLGFLLGNALPIRPRRLGRICLDRIAPNRVLALTILLAAIGLFGTVRYYNPLEEFDLEASNYDRLVGWCLPAAGALAIWLLFNLRPKTPARRLFFYGVLLPLPLLSIVTRTRMPLVFLASFAFLLYVHRLWARSRESFPVVRVATLTAAGAVFLLVAAIVVDVMVDRQWKFGPSRVTVIASVSEDFTGRLQSMATLDAFDMLVRTIQLYPDQGRYLYGWSVVGVIVSPVPRSVWPEKPYGYSRLLVEEFGMGRISGLSWSPSLPGEMVANFGYLGPFLGYFVLGVIWASLFARFRQSAPHSPFHALYLASLMVLLMESRGDLLSISIRLGWYLFLMYAVFRVSLVRVPQALARSAGGFAPPNASRGQTSRETLLGLR